MDDKTFGHFINLLNYISRHDMLTACCGAHDCLFYSFERDEWRVYNETFKVEDIKEIVFRSDGKAYIELETS